MICQDKTFYFTNRSTDDITNLVLFIYLLNQQNVLYDFVLSSYGYYLFFFFLRVAKEKTTNRATHNNFQLFCNLLFSVFFLFS